MVEIRQIQKRDFNAAREFAIEGMHLGWYTRNKIELYLYSKYFWYSELSKATRALGAYVDGRLAGVLLANMKGRPKVFKSIWHTAYVRLATWVMNLGYQDATGPYDAANRKMLEAYTKSTTVDGELIFFAVDPRLKGKGVGTLLLNELERLEKGKHIYLYTDTGSTYQFYERRGFKEEGREAVTLVNGSKETALTCLLYSKTLSSHRE